MLPNNLKYSFNWFSCNCQVYTNVGKVSGYKNPDIQSKQKYMTNYMYFEIMLYACCLDGQGSENAREYTYCELL
jgi:hypothetical protein